MPSFTICRLDGKLNNVVNTLHIVIKATILVSFLPTYTCSCAAKFCFTAATAHGTTPWPATARKQFKTWLRNWMECHQHWLQIGSDPFPSQLRDIRQVRKWAVCLLPYQRLVMHTLDVEFESIARGWHRFWFAGLLKHDPTNASCCLQIVHPVDFANKYFSHSRDHHRLQ